MPKDILESDAEEEDYLSENDLETTGEQSNIAEEKLETGVTPMQISADQQQISAV